MTKKYQNITNKIAPVIALLAVLVIWYVVSEGNLVPAYMLPSPITVVRAFFDNFTVMMVQAWVTLQEAIYGLLIGIVLAFITATLMDRFSFLRSALYPIIVVTQTIPTIAIAPLLVLWMGFEMAPKITLVVITTFFPIAVGLLNGYDSVDKDSVNLMRSMGASRLQIFGYVKFPSALPAFFSGLRISAAYAVVAAVVAEWLGGFEGLGVYMTRVKKAYAFDKMFAVIIFISVISLVLMGIISLIEHSVMPWRWKKYRLSELGQQNGE